MLSAEELLKQARSLNEAKEYTEVVELLKDEQLETLQNADLFAEKAQAYYRLNEKSLCGLSAQKALQIEPANAKANNYQGNLYSDLKEYEKAKECYNLAINSTPAYDAPYNNLGLVYYALKDYERAKEFYNKAVTVNTLYDTPYFNLGLLYYALKDYEKAKEFYNKAIAVNPLYDAAYNSLGNVYYDLKEYEKAEEFYSKAIAINPDYNYPYFNLGRVYHALKEYEKAKEFYNKAIQGNPANEHPYNNLGLLYYALKDYEKAKEFYNKAITVNPLYYAAYNSLGNVYYDLKEYEKAKEFYNKAIEINSIYGYPYYNLAIAYEALKDYEKAKDFYSNYVELTKNTPDYFTELAQSKIIELKKLIESVDYKHISELVNKIKGLLLFKDNCVTHYTGLSVTRSLILENSLFRLSEGAFLNDTSEGRELFDFLPTFTVIPSKLNETEAKLFVPKPFIGSFVSQKKHDDLTLWRMYGKENKEEARGCAITIEREKLFENLKSSLEPDNETNSPEKIDEEFNFYRVAYRRQDNKQYFIIPGAPGEEQTLNELMIDLLDSVNGFLKKKPDPTGIQNLLVLLNRIAFLFKSFEYQYEHEVRLVVKGVGFEKNIDTNFDPPRVYINLVGIRPLIERITLGPKVERAEEWASAFYYSLDKEDLHPEILISHLPFK
jgi:tetratricopeptide (TPR) repeat protein